MRAVKIYTFVLGVFCHLVIWSQRTIMPRVKATTESATEEMILKEMNISIQVIQDRASTSMELVFYNPNQRILEGEFQFPLMDQMQVTGISLDINGRMRNGVVVPKQKAKMVFDDVVRRGIDPALLEKTQGNNYKLRIYPLPAKGERKIRITFDQTLKQKGDKLNFFLPIKGEHRVDKFSVEAKINSDEVFSDTSNPDNIDLDFSMWKNVWVSSIHKENYNINKNISISIPVLSEQRVCHSHLYENQEYFFANLKNSIQPKKNKKEEKVLIYWDNSNSSSKDDQTQKIEFLKQYFNYMGKGQVDFITFNIEKGDRKTFTVTQGVCPEAIEFVKSIKNDAATDLSLIDFPKQYDSFLIFSDGLSNFSSEKISAQSLLKSVSQRVNVVVSNSTSDASLLRQMARKTNGAFINLIGDDVSQAISKIENSLPTILDIRVKKGEISQIYPQIGAAVEDKISLSGILKSDEATLEVVYGYDRENSQTKEIVVRKKSIQWEDNFPHRLFGTALLNYEQEKGSNQEAIDKIGMKYSIVTQGTSLIVLENVSDYVKYKITPPQELKEQYLKYTERQRETEKEQQRETEERKKKFIEKIIEDSKKQTSWWNTNFPNENFKTKQEPKMVLAGASSSVESYRALDASATPMRAMANVAMSQMKGSNGQTDSQSGEIQIVMAGWDPQTPYLKVLEYADENNLENTYYRLKQEYGDSPSFYVDSADFFFKNKDQKTALKIISNLAEISLEDIRILKMLGYKLLEYKQTKKAVEIFEKIREIDPTNPQSIRDLGLALEQDGQYQRAIETLYEVVEQGQEGRFYGIEIIVINEINNIIALHPKLNTRFMEPKLKKIEPVDIRVVIDWDTDNSDMDLWVTDPDGEKCYYQNTLTKLGGKISRDFTQGYGPEEFMIKKAVKGDYKVQVNYYGNRSQKTIFPVSVKVKFFTKYASSKEKVQERVIRITPSNSVIDLATFSYK